jgi:hypothetical protein
MSKRTVRRCRLQKTIGSLCGRKEMEKPEQRKIRTASESLYLNANKQKSARSLEMKLKQS